MTSGDVECRRDRVQKPSQPDFVSTQVLEARHYYLNLAPKPTRAVTVVCGGCEDCQPDYEINRRGFRFYGLEFVARGEGRLRLRGRDYRLRPGMIFAYGPGVPHRIQSDRRAPMTKYYVDFVGERAARMLAASPVGGGRAAQVSDAAQIYELFELLQANGVGASPYRPAICARLLELLLLKISEKAVRDTPGDPRALVSYQRCKNHLAQNFARIRTLADAAQATHVDPAYLCRLFQRFDHCSPYQFLMRLKMNRAAELLLRPETLVKQVAEELQFSDAHNFSRTFKAAFGLSPQRFVQRAKRR